MLKVGRGEKDRTERKEEDGQTGRWRDTVKRRERLSAAALKTLVFLGTRSTVILFVLFCNCRVCTDCYATFVCFTCGAIFEDPPYFMEQYIYCINLIV